MMNSGIIADLHTHTTASDGQYTPTELVQKAKKRGLEVLAITDHDTMDGLEKAIQAGQQCGMHIILGVELSAKEYPAFHILGDGFSLTAHRLVDLCRRMIIRRDERTRRLLAFLVERDIQLTADEIEELAGGDIIGRPHFAQTGGSDFHEEKVKPDVELANGAGATGYLTKSS